MVALTKKTDYLATSILFPLPPTNIPPKDDFWQKWLGVGKFTTHPPRRDNDMFQKKGVKKLFHHQSFKDICALFLKGSEKKKKQAGAELCQAQLSLG